MGKWTKKVEWSPDADADTPVWNDLGHIHQDTDHTQEAAAEETAAGHELYAGTDDVYDVVSYNGDQYEALRQKSLDDETVDLRFTDADDPDELNPDVVKGFSVMVTDPKTFQARERKRFTSRFKRTFI